VKITKERALAVTGIKTVYWLQDFEKVLFEMMTHAETIYINTNEHYRAAVETETREALCKMVERQISSTYCRKKQPNFTTHSFCKESEELDLIQQACTITEKDSEEFYLCETQCDGVRNRS
jgi:Xaa-Pro aminopeptidase